MNYSNNCKRNSNRKANIMTITIPTANTDTHNIEARYELRGGADAFEVPTNGYTLQEITTDMIEFFNGWGERAEIFELDEVADLGEGETRIEIRGAIFMESIDNPRDPNRLESVTVVIDSVEK